LPNKGDGNGEWSATDWAETRQGWIFITSLPAEREALRPLQSLWIDLLVLRLLNEPKAGQKRAWFVIDELVSLQKLPQLHTAITENRKSNNPVILGFQGKAQLEYLYGHLAEVMLSQPATSIWLKTKEPNAGEWVSKFIGKVEIERLTALAFIVTLDDRERFAHSRQVGCYLGLQPKQRQSGESDPQMGIGKDGDPYLRTLMVQAAHCILGPFGQDGDLSALGTDDCNSRRSAREEASHCCAGAQTLRLVASTLGYRRSLRATPKRRDALGGGSVEGTNREDLGLLHTPYTERLPGRPMSF
jgi:hypothetical protein